MAKLYFRYGAVGSAKTLNLLAVAHNYEQQGKRVIRLKPALDTRFGKPIIKSRAGLQAEADLLVDDHTDFQQLDLDDISCILVDEAQFLLPDIIEKLRILSIDKDVPVICYGLRTDFRGNLFPGAKRLMELSDSIEEVKSTCFYCNRKAVMNLKYVNGKPVVEGPTVELGAEEKYHPACYPCYRKLIRNAVEAAKEGVCT
ncbi:MAG: thymidine kinase [Candidatus Algichlamydia australiensis]|nr:thymidine kinase [Chlamydiales bacterium]